MSFKHSLVMFVVLVACVPSAPDLDPHGGTELAFAASDATKGVPFTTPDGWTITVDRVAFRASADVFSTVGSGGGSAGVARFLVPVPSCTLRVTDIAPGPGTVNVTFGYNQYVSEGHNDPSDEPPCGLDAAMLARFRGSADNLDPEDVGEIGPNFIVTGHAEKDGQRVSFDLALSSVIDTNYAWTTVTIRANEGAPSTMPFAVERFFVPSEGSGVPFAEFVGADANGDGNVTAEELDTAQRDCHGSEDPSAPPVCSTVLDDIVDYNATYLFGSEPFPAAPP